MSKAPQALPPPKYKLFLIIWQCVLTLGTVNVLAGSTKDLQAWGVAFSAATFIALCHQMVIIIYCLAPTIMSLTIVEKWIKGPRCPVEQMSPIYSILDQGLQIFAAPLKEKPPEEIMNRLDRLEGELKAFIVLETSSINSIGKILHHEFLFLTYFVTIFLGKADRLKRVNHELLMLINERSEKIEKAFKESVDDNFNLSDVIPLAGGEDYVSAVDIENGVVRTYDPNDYSGGIYDEDNCEAVDIEKDEIVPLETQCAKLALSRIIDPALIKLELYGTRELGGGSCLSDDVPFGYKARKQFPNAGLRKKDSMTFHKESNSTAGGTRDKDKDKDATLSLNQFQSKSNDDHLNSSNHSKTFTRHHSEDSFRNRHSSVSLVDLGAPKQLRPNPSSSHSLFELENQTEARRLSVSNSHYKKPLTMVVSHFVKWERTLEFENWLKELFEIM